MNITLYERDDNLLKISNGKERFWTEILYEKEDKLILRIDNQLIDNDIYDYDDIIFVKNNQYDNPYIYKIVEL